MYAGGVVTEHQGYATDSRSTPDPSWQAWARTGPNGRGKNAMNNINNNKLAIAVAVAVAVHVAAAAAAVTVAVAGAAAAAIAVAVAVTSAVATSIHTAVCQD